MLLVGSEALRQQIPWRKSKDIDYISTIEEYENFIKENDKKIVLVKPTRLGQTVHMIGSKPIEFEIATENSSGIRLLEKYNDVMPPEGIYMLKMSHRFLKNSPHFLKTMNDILELRKQGITIPDELQDIYKQRQKETYNYKHPNLKQGAQTFFSNDGVQYIYDHDTIHETVKIFDKPAFYLIKDNEKDVFCSKERFYSLPFKLQLATVLEETYTLALERSQIPYNFDIDRKKSFDIALMKVCTSITSGWWRSWAYDHYYDAQADYNSDYVDKFKKGLVEGIVKPYKG